jgi:hypothetical protein
VTWYVVHCHGAGAVPNEHPLHGPGLRASVWHYFTVRLAGGHVNLKSRVSHFAA